MSKERQEIWRRLLSLSLNFCSVPVEKPFMYLKPPVSFLIITGFDTVENHRVGDDYCVRNNWELYELFNDMDVAKRINNQRFRWLGYIVRMDEDAPPKRVFDAVVGGHQRVGRQRTHWKHQVEEAVTLNGVTKWRRRAQSRGAWREALRPAETR